jgi:hypothetical protein
MGEADVKSGTGTSSLRIGLIFEETGAKLYRLINTSEAYRMPVSARRSIILKDGTGKRTVKRIP